MSNSSEGRKAKRHWPEADWERSSFADRSTEDENIAWRERQDGLARLTDLTFSGDDFEVRYWDLAAFTPAAGLVLSRRSGVWQSFAFPLIPFKTSGPTTQVPEPDGGWDAFWQRLLELGLLTLEDPNPNPMLRDYTLDGDSSIVEINTASGYRAFTFGGGSERSPLRDQMGRLVGTLHELLRAVDEMLRIEREAGYGRDWEAERLLAEEGHSGSPEQNHGG